jgi:hypothetical protein
MNASLDRDRTVEQMVQAARSGNHNADCLY